MRCGSRSSPRAGSAPSTISSRAFATVTRPRCSPPRSSISGRSASARQRHTSPRAVCRCGPRAMADALGDAVERLWRVIESRRGADPDTSYTAKLFARGTAKIAQKLGEEAVEAVIEGVKGDRVALTGESADLLYHLFVLWAAVGVAPADVATELARREGTSGIAEKKGRRST